MVDPHLPQQPRTWVDPHLPQQSGPHYNLGGSNPVCERCGLGANRRHQAQQARRQRIRMAIAAAATKPTTFAGDPFEGL